MLMPGPREEVAGLVQVLVVPHEAQRQVLKQAAADHVVVRQHDAVAEPVVRGRDLRVVRRAAEGAVRLELLHAVPDVAAGQRRGRLRPQVDADDVFVDLTVLRRGERRDRARARDPGRGKRAASARPAAERRFGRDDAAGERLAGQRVDRQSRRLAEVPLAFEQAGGGRRLRESDLALQVLPSCATKKNSFDRSSLKPFQLTGPPSVHP